MKTMKQAAGNILAAGLIVLGLGVMKEALAASTDTIVLSVTPGNVSYGVQITSVNSNGYQFGTVNLGATTVSTAAIIVKNTGTISEYFGMAVANSTPDTWTAVSVTPSTDQFRLEGYFNATQPSSSTFSNAIPTTVSGAQGGLYNQGSTGRTTPTNTQNLWLRLDMPSYLNNGTGGQQQMVLSINGQGT